MFGNHVSSVITYLYFILAWERVGSQFLRIGPLPLGVVVEGPFHLLSPKLIPTISVER